jgi:mRNA deadenylase 3'-5' endonuclease subunit Ccr4
MECRILSYNTHGLPWSTDTTKPICQWIKSQQLPIVCLQEVFLDENRNYYKEQLERVGYTVVLPRDGIPGIMRSGLLTALLDKEYAVETDCFINYDSYHNVEHFSNKGFLMTSVRHKRTNRPLLLVNTHTQSDSFVSALFGTAVIHRIRRIQAQQLLDACMERSGPALVIGDLNCEVSPHPYLRFLHLHSDLKKHTFPSTGEDLDHIGWLPLQWATCSFCDIDKQGPQLTACEIPSVPWSDHAPLLATVVLPAFPAFPASK